MLHSDTKNPVLSETQNANAQTRDLEHARPSPSVSLWQSLRSNIQQFATNHPYIYSGLIIVFVLAIASVFAMALLPVAGRTSSTRPIEDDGSSPSKNTLVDWSPVAQDDIANTTPALNLFLTQRDITARDVEAPSLEEIQALLNTRPPEYLVPVPEDSTIALEGPLFNFSALFNSTTIPPYRFDMIAATTNFNSLFMLPKTFVDGGNWNRLRSNGTYAEGLTLLTSIDGLHLTYSYLPNLLVGNTSVTVGGLLIESSHARGIGLRGTYQSLEINRSQLRGANFSQAIFQAVTLMEIDMRGADLSGAQFILFPGGHPSPYTSFFSNVWAADSDVSGTVFKECEAWGTGIDGGLNLTGSWSLPGSSITIVDSGPQGFAVSLRDMYLGGANITGNFFDPLDLRGTIVPDDAVMQGNTAIKDGVTKLGGLTVFGGTHLSAKSVRHNQFGRVVCEPRTSKCKDSPLPTTCLDTTPDFYRNNELTPSCPPPVILPNGTLPNITLTTTPHSTFSRTHYHTGPGGSSHRPGLSTLDISLIASVSGLAALTLLLLGICAYKHRQTLCPSLATNHNSLLGSPDDNSSIQADEQTPLKPSVALSPH